MERATEFIEDCFASPAVIMAKEDKSVKIALDSRKLNDVTVKRKRQMPNMEKLISRISSQISEGTDGVILATKQDFDYAYGQIKLDENTKSLCIFTFTGGDFTGYYRFLNVFLRTGRYSNDIPRTDTHNTGTQTPGVTGRHKTSYKGNYGKT